MCKVAASQFLGSMRGMKMFEFKDARDTFADSIEAAARPYCEEIYRGIDAATKLGQFVFCYTCNKVSLTTAKYVVAQLEMFGYTVTISNSIDGEVRYINVDWSHAGGGY